MKLKYAGPKPMISHHGVSFKEGKEDKYVYLMIASQMLKAIDKDYGDNDKYSYDVATKRMLDDDMLELILRYCPTIEQKMNIEISSYQEALDKEYEDANNFTHLHSLEKKALLNNYTIMREYREQRARNKIFYRHIIDTVCEIIKREKIKVIDVPFYEKFWHVLQSIQGELMRGKSPIKTELNVLDTNKDGQLNAKLEVIS